MGRDERDLETFASYREAIDIHRNELVAFAGLLVPEQEQKKVFEELEEVLKDGLNELADRVMKLYPESPRVLAYATYATLVQYLSLLECLIESSKIVEEQIKQNAGG